MDSKILALIATVALLSSVNFSSSNDFSEDFKTFKQVHGKFYETVEVEAYRFAVFVQNGLKIIEHNNKKEGSTQGYTQFADLTSDEFASLYLGYKSNKTPSAEVYSETSFVGDVNWVTAGKVGPVKNQGQCGSCWAFSTVASCESLKAIKDGTIGDFSEQQLVDCSRSYGNKGCQGGLMDDGFKYFKDHGICTESSYPYKGKNGNCAATSCTKDSFTISAYSDVQAKSTASLKSACDKQPVSIAVDASIAWQLYFGGIMAGWECGTKLDHGVELVGYTGDYWLVRNSWGKTWGEKGYIRLHSGDTCGLANEASFPTA